jgi:hypothetical protein
MKISNNKKKIHLNFYAFSYNVFQRILKQLETEEKGLDTFTSAYTHYGIHVDCRTNEIKIKEWAPGARAMYIRGDFSSYLNLKNFIF